MNLLDRKLNDLADWFGGRQLAVICVFIGWMVGFIMGVSFN